jgi:hypothetical protein
MTEQDRLELLKILSRFEGYMFGAKVYDEYIDSQLDYAMQILQKTESIND